MQALHSNLFVYFIYLFRFKQGTFRLNVLPMSKVNIICPHMATSLVKTQDTSSNLRYENFWIVDNSSYLSCNVNTNITENKLLFKCDKPRQIYFEQLVFQSHGMDNSLVFTKGRTYYFICKYFLLLYIIKYVYM